MDTTYESEIQLGQLFKSLGAAFARLAKGMDPAKEQQELKDIAAKLQNAKGYARPDNGCVQRRSAIAEPHLKASSVPLTLQVDTRVREGGQDR